MNVRERNVDADGVGSLSLVPENLDDLWHLKYVVEPGDTVSAITSRRVEGPDDLTRSTGGERETMNVDLEVEDVEFHRFSNRLRIAGVIRSCDRETEVGEHHTLNVEVHDEITVRKSWAPDQLDRLDEAEDAREADVVVATVEEGEGHLHSVESHGVEERGSFSYRGAKGEYGDAGAREEMFEEMADAVARMQPDGLVIAGPGFTKQDFVGLVEDRVDVERVVVEDTSSVGGRGVHEALKRGAVERVAEESRVSREARLIDELMERISDDGAAAYGVEEVERAVEYGAVERLLVVDDFLREHREDVGGLLERVEQKGGEVTVFSSEFEPGMRLESLGGVAALLRYRL
ncbi:MAG: mRNA surveillance protein pelota [Halobacteriales archaeon]